MSDRWERLRLFLRLGLLLRFLDVLCLDLLRLELLFLERDLLDLLRLDLLRLDLLLLDLLRLDLLLERPVLPDLLRLPLFLEAAAARPLLLPRDPSAATVTFSVSFFSVFVGGEGLGRWPWRSIFLALISWSSCLTASSMFSSHTPSMFIL